MSSFTSHYSFRAFAFEQQLATLYAEGQFLANRYEEEDVVNLYRMPANYFVELFYDQHLNQVVRLRTFVSSNCLADYTSYINLTDLGL